MTKNLPQSAERYFALMCADAGVACNRSEEDVNGWDFVIEYPARPIKNLPRDMAPGEQTCFVQVKSSKNSKNIKIKLSNALRFSQSPAPCFIVLFLADTTGSIADIFVIHFWQDLIARTLRRVRELEKRGVSEFHKHTITMRFDEKFRVDAPLEYIRQAIDGLGNGYEEAKRKLFQSIGFDDGGVTGHFTLAPGTTLDDLLDHQLGKKAPINLSNFVVHSSRFGIKSPIPLVNASAGLLKITPHPVGDCSVVLTFGTTDEQVTFSGKIVVPHIPGLPEDKRTIQIVANPIEIIFQPASGKGRFEATKSYSEKMPIAELAKFVRLCRLSQFEEVDCKVIYEGRVIFGADLTPDKSQKPEPLWDALECFFKILTNSIGFQGATSFSTSITELAGCFQKIIAFNELAQGATININAKFDRVFPSKSMCFLSYRNHIAINDHIVVAFVLRSGEPSFFNDQIKCEFGEPIRSSAIILKGTLSENTAFIEGEVKRLTERSDKEYSSVPIIYLNDITKLAEQKLTPNNLP